MRSVACVLLLASLAIGKEPQTVKVEKTIFYSNGTQMLKQGSGVICGSSPDGSLRAVLTVHHVAGGKGRIRVSANGKRYGGLLVGSDPRLDVALVLIKGNLLQRVPDARLWLGQVDSTQVVRGEGFPSGSFRATSMQPLGFTPAGRLVTQGAVMPGTSGGPIYVVTKSESPRFVTVASHSDLRRTTLGPYRSHIAKFVETCSAQGLDFSFNSGGSIDVIPQVPRQLDGPMVLPESSSEANERNELMRELRDLLKQKAQVEETSMEVAQSKPRVTKSKPKLDPSLALFDDNAQVDVVVTIPLKLRVNVDDNGLVSIEQWEPPKK